MTPLLVACVIVDSLLAFMNLFAVFQSPSWDGWRVHLARLTPSVREFYAAVGRGAGKSMIVALIACFFATREYRRAPGEKIYIGVIAPDRRQAGITHRYVVGLLQSVPALASLIVNETRDSVELANGVIVEVVTANLVAPRGRSYALVVVEEAAFLPDDAAANPDVEIIRAVRPALARVPGSLLAVVSSTYARRGVLWNAVQRHATAPSDDVLVVQAATLDLNPTFDRISVERAYADDPASAAAEYGGQFRADLETYVSIEALHRVVIPGRTALPPIAEADHCAFVDPSGGSGADSFTLAIAHGEECDDGRVVAVLDAIREVKPPFSPEAAVAEFAEVLKSYRIVEVTGDRFAGEWPREAFRRHGIEYRVSERAKSDIYAAFLPALNSVRVELLDHPRLLAQLGALERRVGPSGRDAIDHPSRSHDDAANSACGALLIVLEAAAQPAPGIFVGGW